MTQKIIHCDCDCFFAAIEMRDDPALRDRPLAVGGGAERRGVVATCNYEARRYGVHSAMPTAHALRLCPELIVVPPAMDKYRMASRQVMAILGAYSEVVEPLSLDEAYVDVSRADACRGSATLMAAEIRRRVREEVGITVSAGVAPNKFLAKIASDWHKPDGQFVITPAMVGDFVRQLPVSKLHGVGRVTARRLAELDITTCAQLQALPLLELTRLFGSFGERLHALSRGIDERPVVAERERKSVSVEHTYASDLPDLGACLAQLPELQASLARRLAGADAPAAIGKQFVKMRFHDFVSTTVEQRLPGFGCAEPDPALFETLCRSAFERGNKAVRLLGLGIRLAASPNDPRQLPLPFKGGSQRASA